VKPTCIEGSPPGRNFIYSGLQVTRPAPTAVLDHTPIHQVGLAHHDGFKDQLRRLDLSELLLRVWIERLQTQSGPQRLHSLLYSFLAEWWAH
jgi:hypothetical protein